MRDAIVFSTWDWDTFNVPERIALALSLRGFRVLYCDMPVSRMRSHGKPLRQIHDGIHGFGPEYLGERFDKLPALSRWQWNDVGRQIWKHATALGMENPIFLYSHVKHLAPLLRTMHAHGCPLVHICMDYPEAYQYELIALSDRTLVIPEAVTYKLRARYGNKIFSIPQSIHFRDPGSPASERPSQVPEIANLPQPRLGYLGPIFGRLNLPLLREVLEMHPDWHFICFGDSSAVDLPNVHGVAWRNPNELPDYVRSLDIGLMPYDCFEEKNLHCVPLKLFDYFAAGLPVVSTPVISLWGYSELIYFGETGHDFASAVECALREPKDSPQRAQRIAVAHEHSTEVLSRRLEQVLDFETTPGD
jgi:glycosyltransferase involved in cell wall biosynthesis